MNLKRGILSGCNVGKLKANTCLELPIDAPAWANKGPAPNKRHEPNRWYCLGDNPKTYRFADLWPDGGLRPPCRADQHLYVPAGVVVVDTCQSLFDGGFEITYRFADGALSKPQYSKQKRLPGRKYKFHKRKMARLILGVVSVEPMRRGKRVFWHVIYRIETSNEAKAASIHQPNEQST